jgi:alcohol dehydrogenase (cytochrome c)
MGVRGWLKALDLASGKLLWTAYSTGPDSDVKIGSRFKAFYPKDRGKDLGVNSWPASSGRSAAATCGAGSRTIPH